MLRRLLLPATLAASFAALAPLGGCTPSASQPPAGAVTTVILLRHADRHPLQAGLNQSGLERAAALPTALEGVPIDEIYTLDIERNRQTAQPLATARGLPVRIVAERGVAEMLMRGNAGKTVVWIGNTDNLADIHRALGGDGAPPDRYGDLFILRVPERGPTIVTRMIYGRAPAGAS
ncbi:MAG: histidine phosphatase family protein [Alphaproteobacteria bacterium]|nr:histidine phosphatase family protein [Alphaproteobacteria bacterium]